MNASVYPVIHVLDRDRARAEAATIHEAGADGVWLINHGQSPHELADVIGEMRAAGELPGWTGANFLGLGARAAWEYAGELDLDGLWTDNAGIHSGEGWEERAAEERRVRGELAPGTAFFGGVSFKYQPHRVAPDVEASAAAEYLDVVTTSGPGTAAAADEEKLRAMSEAVGRERLAVASGVTPDNAERQLRHVAHVLVASGIARDWHHVDETLLGRLLTVRDRIRLER